MSPKRAELCYKVTVGNTLVKAVDEGFVYRFGGRPKLDIARNDVLFCLYLYFHTLNVFKRPSTTTLT